MAGQSINDRLTAARYSIAGQGLAKSVCKATTEEVIGPKKKHLDYLLQCTNEPNVSIPQLANLLIERTQSQAWVIVFKALITVHTLMCYGNERFTQYLASSNCKFNLSGFLDKTGTSGATATQNQPQLSYDMSTFVRRYAKYINEKAISYRTVAFDFCKVKRGKNEGTVRTMSTDQLLKTLPILQQHLDALLDFDCTASELNNGVINAAFMLLFRDLIRLFACYNDGIINLLEKYFDMNKKQCRDALDCYKKFLIRMDRVSEFLKVAETVGMDKSEIPDLKQQSPDIARAAALNGRETKAHLFQIEAPSSLLEALEGHLASLEGKKYPPTGVTAGSDQFESVLTALTNTSTSFGLASSNGSPDTNGTSQPATNGGGAPSTMEDSVKKQALADEEAMYEKLRAEAAKNNPFLSSPTAETAPPIAASTAPPPPTDSGQILDLFSAEAPVTQTDSAQQPSSKASDDLLQLAGNPFADMMGGLAASAPPPQQPYSNGFSSPFSHPFSNAHPIPSSFVSDNNFVAAFGQQNSYRVVGQQFAAPPADNVQSSAFDGFGDILKPEGGSSGGNTAMAAPTGAAPGSTKLISGDLDSSLSSLVDNLNMKGPSGKPQWSSPKTPNKTGGANWAPQPTGMMRPQGQQWSMGNPQMAPVGVAPQQPPPQQQPAGFDPFGAL